MTITQDLPSKLELIPGFIREFMEKISHLSLSHDDTFDIKLAMEEALVNAIKHGNKLNPDLAVGFVAEIREGKIEMRVTNGGTGFDYNSIPDPTAQDKMEKTSGRGVFLIKKLMDRVEFSDCGRTIKMVKFIQHPNI